MNFTITDAEADYGTLEVVPGRDDSFTVAASGERGETKLRLPLYAYEARELIEVLRPLAETNDLE